jgi:hypothetical protein
MGPTNLVLHYVRKLLNKDFCGALVLEKKIKDFPN